jgi:hypothetical protein
MRDVHAIIGIMVALVILVAAFVATRSVKPAPTVIPNTPTRSIDFSPQLGPARAAAQRYTTKVQAATKYVTDWLLNMPMFGAASGVSPPTTTTAAQAVAAQGKLRTAWGDLVNAATQYSGTLSGWTPKTDLATVMSAGQMAATLKANSLEYIGQAQGHIDTIYNYSTALSNAYESAGRTIGMPAGTRTMIMRVAEARLASIPDLTKSLPADIDKIAATGSSLAQAATSL